MIAQVSTRQGVDSDSDGIFEGADGDGDGDGIPNSIEIANAPSGGDTDGDGIMDIVETGSDFDRDLIPNARDLDSDGDGINDVFEAGGIDADGDGLQDSSGDADPDEDKDGIVDSVDFDDAIAAGGNGSELLVPDSDMDDAPDFLDLDSDNDLVSDLVESGSAAADLDDDGMTDGADSDGDGISSSVDGLAALFGDFGALVPQDTDGDGMPDYRDTNSDGAGSMDIVGAGGAALDTDGNGMIDGTADIDEDGIIDVADDNTEQPGGLGFDLITFLEWAAVNFVSSTDAGQLADPDKDGCMNAEEFAFGTDPMDAKSVPVMGSELEIIDGVPVIQVVAETSETAFAFVIVEASGELSIWSSAPTDLEVVIDEPGSIAARVEQVTGSSGGNRGFVRFKVIVP